MALKILQNRYMTHSKTFFLSLLLLLASCTSDKEQKTKSLTDSSLTELFEQLIEKTNPFEFYKEVYENFKFELKSTLILSEQEEDAPPLESITIFESNEQDESRFLKKSLEPISEVEWIEKQDKDFIRYDDSSHFLRTSYNPEFEKWKKRMFQDISSIFDLKELEKKKAKTEKNQWSCFESEKQKICVDSKTGLPVFGKAIKQIKPDTAVSMVFSLAYGQDAPAAIELEKKVAPPVKPKKQTLQKKKKV